MIEFQTPKRDHISFDLPILSSFPKEEETGRNDLVKSIDSLNEDFIATNATGRIKQRRYNSSVSMNDNFSYRNITYCSPNTMISLGTNFNRHSKRSPVLEVLENYRSFFKELAINIFMHGTKTVNTVLPISDSPVYPTVKNLLEKKGDLINLSQFSSRTKLHPAASVPSIIQTGIRSLRDETGKLTFYYEMDEVLGNYLQDELLNFLVDGGIPNTNCIDIDSKYDDLSHQKRSVESCDDCDSYEDCPECLDEIDLTIELGSIKNIMFVQEPAVPFFNDTIYFNLPSFIERELANDLFEHFWKSIYRIDPDSSAKEEIGWIHIALPLAFGNVTVLQCMLVYSGYHIVQQIDSGEKVQVPARCLKTLKDTDFLVKLHKNIMMQLKNRINFVSSVCCDHSLFCLLLLLSVELLRGGCYGTLWFKLMETTQSMLPLRGGVNKILKSLAGQGLLNMLTVHFFSSIPFKSLAGSEGYLDQEEFLAILNSCSDANFYDNINYYSHLGFDKWKPVLEVYAKIGYLYRSLSDCEPELYSSTMQTRFANILCEAQSISKSLEVWTFDDFINQLNSECKMLVQFSKDVAKLYISQVIFRRPSSSPETIVLVKTLLEKSKSLFQFYEHRIIDGSLLVPILPFMVLGIDIADFSTREWYLGELHGLYKMTHKPLISDICDILEDIWCIDCYGKNYIDWIDVCEQNKVVLPLYN